MSTDRGQVTVRVTEDTRELLRWLSENEGRSMQAVLRSALEVYRRQRFLDEINAGYAELRRDRRSWQEWTTERMLWDRTLSDGLVAEPRERYGKARPKRKKRR
jgi:predicted transcriptional regulator